MDIQIASYQEKDIAKTGKYLSEQGEIAHGKEVQVTLEKQGAATKIEVKLNKEDFAAIRAQEQALDEKRKQLVHASLKNYAEQLGIDPKELVSFARLKKGNV